MIDTNRVRIVQEMCENTHWYVCIEVGHKNGIYYTIMSKKDLDKGQLCSQNFDDIIMEIKRLTEQPSLKEEPRYRLTKKGVIDQWHHMFIPTEKMELGHQCAYEVPQKYVSYPEKPEISTQEAQVSTESTCQKRVYEKPELRVLKVECSFEHQ